MTPEDAAGGHLAMEANVRDEDRNPAEQDEHSRPGAHVDRQAAISTTPAIAASVTWIHPVR
jgi:hypothetical protein